MGESEGEFHKTIAIADRKGAQDCLVGLVLDNRYEIEEKIGEGGQGDVYRGRQLRLKRPVAIKIPRPELLRDKRFRRQFEAEAATMARCVHENIVTIYDVHIAPSPEEFSYIVMQLVSGTELAHFLHVEEANLTVNAVLEILVQLARGIDAAHGAGVIHRDIKPQNVIVTMPKRVVKIMDFGMAKSLYHSDKSRSLNGTPAYMAPEQVSNEALGPYTDIYAFGAVIYRILTRHGHHEGKSLRALLFAVTNKPPIPLRERNANWPQALEDTIARSLDSDPEKRPTTALQLVNQVAEALSDVKDRPFAEFFQDRPASSSVSRRKRKMPRHRILIASSVAAIVLLLVSLILFSGVANPGAVNSGTGAANTGSSDPLVRPLTPDGTDAGGTRPGAGSLGGGVGSLSIDPGPSVRGPLLLGSEKRAEAKAIFSELLYKHIRLPIFRQQLESAKTAFLNISDPSVSDEFFEMIENLGQTHKQLKLKFEANETIYRSWAKIAFRFEIVGKPRVGKKNKRAKEETVVSEFTAVVHFLKKEKRWTLIDWPTTRFVDHVVQDR